jgi:hypothetical protein
MGIFSNQGDDTAALMNTLASNFAQLECRIFTSSHTLRGGYSNLVLDALTLTMHHPKPPL